MPGNFKDMTANLNESDSLAEDVIAYFASHYGPVEPVAQIEIVPTAWPPIDIHIITSTKDRDCITLFTTGMSDEPMSAPRRRR